MTAPAPIAVHGTAGEGGEGVDVRVDLRRRIVEVRLPCTDWQPDGSQHWLPVPYAVGGLEPVLAAIADCGWQCALSAWSWYGEQWALADRAHRIDLRRVPADQTAPWLALAAWLDDGGTLDALRQRRHDAGLEEAADA